MYFNNFSEVFINNFLILKSSDIYTEKIPENHHFYMLIGIDKYIVEDFTRDELNENRLIITIKSLSNEFKLIWDFECVVSNFEISLDKRSVLVNGKSYFILDVLLDLVYKSCDIQISSEILYIGQAKGIRKSRNVGERLENHETLQKILSDCVDSRINYDIIIISFSIFERLISTTLPYGTPNSCLEDIYRNEDKSINISYNSLINLVEAKLINKFKPKYNKYYISGSVPYKKHTSYLEYNKLFKSMFINLSKLSSFYFKQKNIEFNPRKDAIEFGWNEV